MHEHASRVEIHLIPLDILGRSPFDLSQLPLEIGPNLKVADVSSLVPYSIFEYMKVDVGSHRLSSFRADRKYGVVHSYEEPYPYDLERSNTAREPLNNAFCLLRLIRPHRRGGRVMGEMENGVFSLRETLFPQDSLDVPEALKLFYVRNKDLLQLRQLLPSFLQGMRGPYWPFRMATQYYYMGYEVNDWKGRYLYWGSSAIHALYSHKEQKIVPRIKAFLGENTLIYDPADHPEFEFLDPSPLRIKDVLDDVNEVRNCIAHGDRIPQKYFSNDRGRDTLNGRVSFITVLDDSLAFIVRETLLKILRDDLLERFKSRHEYTSFWKTLGV